MVKRVCDFCGQEINDSKLYFGLDSAKPLKIMVGGSDDELDVCYACCYKIKQICRDKELLKNQGE